MKLPITLKFDDFINLTRSMFESNPYVVVQTNGGTYYSFDILRQYYKYADPMTQVVTLTSISINIPQFSIGDTVMIVDTGEIGKIDSKSMNYDWMIELQSGKPFVANNHELVKIPSDLLPILQD